MCILCGEFVTRIHWTEKHAEDKARASVDAGAKDESRRNRRRERIRLEGDGENRVRVSGIKGRPATEFLKVSISYSAGYKAVGTLVYSWPDAYAKAQAADKILRQRLDRLGLKFDQILTEYVGANALHGKLSGEPSADLPEVQLRVGVRGEDKSAMERFTKEIAPLILTGPPGVTGFAGGRPKVEEIVAYWPALIPKSEIKPRVEVREV